MLSLLLHLEIFHECPRVRLSTLRSKKACKDVVDNPAFSLNTSSRSALLQCYSSDHKPSLLSLSW